MTDLATVTASDARALEHAFLSGLNEAQDAFERILQAEAWRQLGHDTFADWWNQAVEPVMSALSMRPTREIAEAVVDRVRTEEASLPATQRRTQKEIAEMVGVTQQAISSRSRQDKKLSRADLEDPTPQPDPQTPESAGAVAAPPADSGTTRDEEPAEVPTRTADPDAVKAAVNAALDKFVPDPDGPKRVYLKKFYELTGAPHDFLLWLKPDDFAAYADDEDMKTLKHLADGFADAYRRAVDACTSNVTPLRRVK